MEKTHTKKSATVKENYDAVINTLNPTKKQPFAEWVLRHWKDKIPAEVNAENFFDEYQTFAVNMPIGLPNLIDMFVTAPSIKKGLGRIRETDLDDLKDSLASGEVAYYHKGEVSLKEIGKHIGQVSKTTVMNITEKSVGKLNSLVNLYGAIFGSGTDSISEGAVDVEAVADEVDFIMLEQSKIWAKLFCEMKTFEAFRDKLLKLKMISKDDVEEMSEAEKTALEELALFAETNDEDIVQLLLFQDIDQGENNVIKSFQSSVARAFHSTIKSKRDA